MNPSLHTSYTLLIADDHQLITDGISKLLEGERIIAEIFVAHNGKEAMDMALNNPIDCILMDIHMPMLNGLEATKGIRQKKPDLKIIALSMESDTSIVSKILKAGADGFIHKDTGKQELVDAIQKVMNGEKYISQNISFQLFTQLSDNHNTTAEEKKITPREKEIIKYISDGYTNQEIAKKLFLSVATVDTHRKNILTKLQLKNTAALVKYAADHHLL